MKRHYNEHENSANKKQKIEKSLEILLSEVNQGEYQDFRTWLKQNNYHDLNLNSKASNINLSYLAQALKGTTVTSVDLSWSNIGPHGAKD